jgi:hypothetical protein
MARKARTRPQAPLRSRIEHSHTYQLWNTGIGWGTPVRRYSPGMGRVSMAPERRRLLVCGLGTVGPAGHANLKSGRVTSDAHRLGARTRGKWSSQRLEHDRRVEASYGFRGGICKLALAEPAVGDERLSTPAKRSGILS